MTVNEMLQTLGIHPETARSLWQLPLRFYPGSAGGYRLAGANFPALGGGGGSVVGRAQTRISGAKPDGRFTPAAGAGVWASDAASGDMPAAWFGEIGLPNGASLWNRMYQNSPVQEKAGIVPAGAIRESAEMVESFLLSHAETLRPAGREPIDYGAVFTELERRLAMELGAG